MLARVARSNLIAISKRVGQLWRCLASRARTPRRAANALVARVDIRIPSETSPRGLASHAFVRFRSPVLRGRLVRGEKPVVCAPGPIVAMRAFATVDSERARASKARDELRKQQARVETVEKFSGLRIRNRVVASMVLEDKFADLRFAASRPPPRLPGRWATAGVLVDKSVKQSSSGTSYSVWKLSDLTPNDNCVTVFLFGQALDHHREPGAIWTVCRRRQASRGRQIRVSHGGVRPRIYDHEDRHVPGLRAVQGHASRRRQLHHARQQVRV